MIALAQNGGTQLRGVRIRLIKNLARLLQVSSSWIEHRRMEEILRLYGAARASRIPTWTSPKELRTLYRLATQLPQGSLAVEIGSYLGASACFLAAGLTEVDGHLVCVDTWRNETMPEGPRDTHEEFLANTRGFANRITALRKPTSELKAKDFPKLLALAFIDGDHAYEQAREDVARVLPSMAPDGVLCLHDFGNANHPGVSRLISELLAGGEWTLFRVVDSLACLRRTASLNTPVRELASTAEG